MEGDSAPADEPPAACEAAAAAFPRAPAPLRTGPSRSPLRNGVQAPGRCPAAGQARGRRSPAAARQAPADEACEAAAEAFPRTPAPLRTGPSRSPLRNGARVPRRSPAAGQARGRRSPAAARQAPADEACKAAAEAIPRGPAPLRTRPFGLPLRTRPSRSPTVARAPRRSPAAGQARGQRSPAEAAQSTAPLGLAVGQAEAGATPRSPAAVRTGPGPRSLGLAAPHGPAAMAELPSGQAGADGDAGGAASVQVSTPAPCAQVAVSGGQGVDEEYNHLAGTDSLERFDLDTSFLLKIKLLGNPKKRRKDMKCFSIEMTEDSDLTNYNDLVESVVNKYPLGYTEVAHVQYYDEVLKSFPEITTDQQLMTMFSKHSKSKVISMFIAYCGPSDVFEPISEWDFDGERQPDNNSEPYLFEKN